MAIRNSRFELTTGVFASASTGAVGYSGGAAQAEEFAQPSLGGQIDAWGKASGTLAASGTATIDLTALTGPDGSTVTLTAVVAGYVQITSTTAGGKLAVGNAASNANQLGFGNANDTWTIRANGPGLAFGDPEGTGITVDSSHRNVKVENTSGVSVDWVAYFGGAT